MIENWLKKILRRLNFPTAEKEKTYKYYNELGKNLGKSEDVLKKMGTSHEL